MRRHVQRILSAVGMLLLLLVSLASIETRPLQEGVASLTGVVLQNLLPNGDFENDLDGWTPVESAAITTSIVHSGNNAFRASDPDSSQYSYIWREFALDFGRNEVRFWVYPESDTYLSAFELISNWQQGTAVFNSRVLLRDGGVSVTAVDTSATIPDVLIQNGWNEVVIQIDSLTRTQDFFVNGALVSSLTSDSLPPAEHLLVGDLSISGMWGTVYFDDISITGTGSVELGCPFVGDPILVLDDTVMYDSIPGAVCTNEGGEVVECDRPPAQGWVSEIITNTTAPQNPWTLDISLKTEDTGVSHYPPAGNPPPGRWVRYSNPGPAIQGSTVEVANWYARTIEPATGGFGAVQFDFDFWGSEQRMGPLIFQDGTYYEGPTIIASRADDWLAYSSGCLGESDFARLQGSGPERPDFLLPFVVGYTLRTTTNRTSDLRDHLLDNFRFFADRNFTWGEPPPIPNRPPFASNDELILKTSFQGIADEPGCARWKVNDRSLDGFVTMNSFTNGRHGTVAEGIDIGLDPSGGERPFEALCYTQTEVSPDAKDDFTYTIGETDSDLEASAFVLVLYDYACPLEGNSDGQAASKAVEDSLDLDLIRRFRDDVMEPAVDGSRYVRYYYRTTEILKLLALDRRDLGVRAVRMARMLQPSIRDVLDGGGDLPLTQAQMDTVGAVFADLSAAGSDSLKALIDRELGRLGSLDDYVGVPVRDALKSVLGDDVGTAAEKVDTDSPDGEDRIEIYPNPFWNEARVLLSGGKRGAVTITVHDIRGRRVRRLYKSDQRTGQTAVTWDGRDESGRAVASGVYLIRLVTNGEQKTISVLLTR